MAVTLGDILLVLLDDRPGTAHDLHQRHAATLASVYPVDIGRVVSSLGRQGRSGYVDAGETPAGSRKRMWQLTDDGHDRQRAWLLDIRPGASVQEILIRTLLALEAADRGTFEAVVDSCVTVVEQRRSLLNAKRARTVEVAGALAEYERAELTTLIDWLRSLRARPRRRDHHVKNSMS